MLRIFILGTGNLGGHLVRYFDSLKKSETSDVALKGYSNASKKVLPGINAPLIENIAQIPEVDMILLAVGDNQIEVLNSQLPLDGTTIVHTSGSISLDALNHHKNRGVLYLPQSFSTDRKPHFNEITACLEASNDHVLQQLGLLGNTLSRKRKYLNSLQRKNLHLAAVYINNFVNHCYTKGFEILEKENIPTELLLPLMQETLEKANDLSPANAQTGPAVRGDSITIQSHFDSLSTSDQEMYAAITRSINKKINL
ncbi:MAG: DUF2520 domain-containing protein [Nonlabens sp.]